MISLKTIKDFTILILIGLLVFALIRGCQNNNLRVAANHTIDSLVTKSKRDNAKMYNDSLDYIQLSRFADGKIELNYNQYVAYVDSVHVLNNYITKLKSKRIFIEPKLDTSIMHVPTEYVAQCNDCWGELDHYKSVVDTYTNRADSLRASYVTKNIIQEQRIKQLNNEKATLSAAFNDCVTIGKEQQKKYSPKRKLKMLFSPAAIGQLFPNSIGLGGIYEDKRDRGFGGQYYLTPHGPMYVLHLEIPIIH